MFIEYTTPQLMVIGFESPFQQVLQQQRRLLRSFNKKKKWQLWLSDRPMLQRSWLKIAGLDTNKVVHLYNLKNENLVSTIEKALQNKTCSYVVACIANITEQDKLRLKQAVLMSNTCLLLIADETKPYHQSIFQSYKNH